MTYIHPICDKSLQVYNCFKIFFLFFNHWDFKKMGTMRSQSHIQILDHTFDLWVHRRGKVCRMIHLLTKNIKSIQPHDFFQEKQNETYKFNLDHESRLIFDGSRRTHQKPPRCQFRESQSFLSKKNSS